MDKKLYLICSVEYCFNMPSLFAMDSDGKYYGEKNYPELRGYPKDVQYWREATSSDSDRFFFVVECGRRAYENAFHLDIPDYDAAERRLCFLALLNDHAWREEEADKKYFLLEYLSEENFEFFQPFRHANKKRKKKIMDSIFWEDAVACAEMDIFDLAEFNRIEEENWYDEHEDDEYCD